MSIFEEYSLELNGVMVASERKILWLLDNPTMNRTDTQLSNNKIYYLPKILTY
jgi:hypothetical protein